MKQTHPLIYCVEDEDSIRGLISYVLNGQGFEVGTFESSGPFLGRPGRTPASTCLARHYAGR